MDSCVDLSASYWFSGAGRLKQTFGLMGFVLRKPINLEFHGRGRAWILPYTTPCRYRWIKDKDNVQPSQFNHHTLFSKPLTPQVFLNVNFCHTVPMRRIPITNQGPMHGFFSASIRATSLYRIHSSNIILITVSLAREGIYCTADSRLMRPSTPRSISTWACDPSLIFRSKENLPHKICHPDILYGPSMVAEVNG